LESGRPDPVTAPAHESRFVIREGGPHSCWSTREWGTRNLQTREGEKEIPRRPEGPGLLGMTARGAGAKISQSAEVRRAARPSSAVDPREYWGLR